MLLGMVISWINTRRSEAVKGSMARVSVPDCPCTFSHTVPAPSSLSLVLLPLSLLPLSLSLVLASLSLLLLAVSLVFLTSSCPVVWWYLLLALPVLWLCGRDCQPCGASEAEPLPSLFLLLLLSLSLLLLSWSPVLLSLSLLLPSLAQL